MAEKSIEISKEDLPCLAASMSGVDPEKFSRTEAFMKFYRLDPSLIRSPDAHDSLQDLRLDGFSERLKPMDGIVLAQWNNSLEVGEVKVLGLVISVSSDRLTAKIRWRRVDITLRPNPGGRQFWKNQKGWFCFAKEVADRYALRDLQAEFFPDYTGFEFSPPPPVTPLVGKTSSPTPGFVYVIRSEHGFKIGKTVNMKNRTRLFEVKLPFPISIEHYAWFEDYSHAERSLHMQYHAKRLEGEWFDLSIADLAQIKTQGKQVPVAGL